jgi:acyl-CoA reductase-like NAD-dependent aldehyde dehydrogenase
MELKFYNIVNDELRSSTDFEKVIDPRTEEALWDVPIASVQDLEDAVAAASNAFPAWSQTTVAERQAVLVKMSDVLTQNSKILQDIVMKETGKSVSCSSLLVE